MRTFSIPQIFENAVNRQGGTVRKYTNKNMEARGVIDEELIISTLFNALPADFEIKRGVAVNGRTWFQVWTPLRYDGPACYHFSFREGQ